MHSNRRWFKKDAMGGPQGADAPPGTSCTFRGAAPSPHLKGPGSKLCYGGPGTAGATEDGSQQGLLLGTEAATSGNWCRSREIAGGEQLASLPLASLTGSCQKQRHRAQKRNLCPKAGRLVASAYLHPANSTTDAVLIPKHRATVSLSFQPLLQMEGLGRVVGGE